MKSWSGFSMGNPDSNAGRILWIPSEFWTYPAKWSGFRDVSLENPGSGLSRIPHPVLQWLRNLSKRRKGEVNSVYSENRAKTLRRLRHRRFVQTDDGVDAETFLPDFLNKLNFTFASFGEISQQSCTWSQKGPSTSWYTLYLRALHVSFLSFVFPSFVLSGAARTRTPTTRNGPYSPKGKKWRPRAPGGIMPR